MKKKLLVCGAKHSKFDKIVGFKSLIMMEGYTSFRCKYTDKVMS